MGIEFNNCFDKVFFNILKKNNFPVYLYFIKCLYFDFYKIIDNNVVLKNPNRNIEQTILREIYNIDLNFDDSNDYSIETLISNEEIHYVGLLLDSYYCDWLLFYKQKHINHPIIVNKYYIDKDIIEFEDSFSVLDEKDLKRNIKDICGESFKKFFIVINNQKKINYRYVKKFIKNILLHYDKLNENYYNLFIENINEKYLLNMSNSVETNEIIIGLNNIATDRNNFICFLDSYINDNKKKDILEKELEDSKKLFLVLKAIITKFYLTNKINKEHVKNTVTEIKEIDKKIFFSLKAFWEAEMEKDILDKINVFLKTNYSADDDLVINSIDFIKLIVNIECAYEIQFDNDNLLISKYSKISDLIEYICTKIYESNE